MAPDHKPSTASSVRVALILPLLAAGAPLAAQEPLDPPRRIAVHGVVVDAGTNHGVAATMVEIVNLGVYAVTDSTGAFMIPDLRPGSTYTFEATRLGYDAARERWTAGADTPLLIRLEPKPVVLQGLTAMVDRVKRRRNAMGVASQVFERGQLLGTLAPSIGQFLRERSGAPLVPCPLEPTDGWNCILSRGRPARVQLYLDEAPMPAPGFFLEAYHPSDFELVEYYPSLRMVRLYTGRYLERLAGAGLALAPIWIP